MRALGKGMAIGAASGAVSWLAAVVALGYTNALAMPKGTSLLLWEATIVFGLGAGVVALAIHLVALRLFKATPVAAALGFVLAVVGLVAATGAISQSGKFIAAVVLGGLCASAVASLRSNSSFKPTSLRDAA